MNRPHVVTGLLIGFFALQSSFSAAGQVPKEKELKTEMPTSRCSPSTDDYLGIPCDK